jgi:hypothetical protein
VENSPAREKGQNGDVVQRQLSVLESDPMSVSLRITQILQVLIVKKLEELLKSRLERKRARESHPLPISLVGSSIILRIETTND